MMKKFLIYTLAFTALGSSTLFAADELDNILFADTPKKEQASSLISPPKLENQIRVENKPTLLQPMQVDADEFDFENVVPAIEDNYVPASTPVDAKKNTDNIVVGATDISLTDAIRNESKTSNNQDSVFSGTWVEKLKDTQFNLLGDEATSPVKEKKITSSADKGLEMMMDSSKKQIGKSNASVFDISGVMLRMSQPQVEAIMTKRGYKLVSQKFEIPNFIKWRFEDNCRNAGVVGYERIASCVVKAAKENKHQYVESSKFSKFDTKEEVSISFTSNFTNNKVYKIVYKSMSTKNMNGSGQKAQYLYDIKVYDFWKRINQKYGVPDNKEDVIWGMGGNKPYMKAATGSLMLEDPMLRELDFTRMSREDQKFINTNIYNF